MGVRGNEGSESIVFDIVRDVADREGVAVDDLPVLYDQIDVESVVQLLDSTEDSSEITVVFQYAGYRITVDGAGDVEVRSAESDGGNDRRIRHGSNLTGS